MFNDYFYDEHITYMRKPNLSNVIVIRGRTSFAKLLGDPVGNKFDDTKNWSVDVKLTPETVKELRSLGLKDKIKEKDGYLNGQPHITFKHPEYRFDGTTKNDPIKVVDADGKTEWDQNKLIGNDTVADFKFVSPDPKPGRKRGMYLRSVRILDHVPYERSEFGSLSENDEYFEAAKAAEKKAQEYAQFQQDFDQPDRLDDSIDDVADEEL